MDGGGWRFLCSGVVVMFRVADERVTRLVRRWLFVELRWPVSVADEGLLVGREVVQRHTVGSLFQEGLISLLQYCSQLRLFLSLVQHL